MIFNKLSEAIWIALAGFAKEPTCGFLEQVVEGLGLGEEDFGYGVGVVELTFSDELHGGDDADALFPEGFPVAGKVVEEAAVFVEEPFAEEGIAAEVDEVPIVDVLGVGEVEVDVGFLCGGVFLGVAKEFDEDEECGEANFVIGAGNAFLEFVHRTLIPKGFDYLSGGGHFDAEKEVAFAILSGAAFEKSHEPFRLGGVGLSHHLVEEDVHVWDN